MLLIKNISNLETLNDSVGTIKDAAVLVENGKVFWCGTKADLPDVEISKTIDAQKKLVMPGLIDCHTHLVFAGSRAGEFSRRMNNESYLSIMKDDGGIMATVRKTRSADEETLFNDAKLRLDKIILSGVTTIEAKSGYGLNVNDEVKILKVLKKLNEKHRIDIHSTFMGAHAIPSEYADSPSKYVDLIIKVLLPMVCEEKLAIDCDIFCEHGAFDISDSKTILKTAQDLGLGLRAHIQQLGHSGGVNLLDEFKFKSISHSFV